MRRMGRLEGGKGGRLIWWLAEMSLRLGRVCVWVGGGGCQCPTRRVCLKLRPVRDGAEWLVQGGLCSGSMEAAGRGGSHRYP